MRLLIRDIERYLKIRGFLKCQKVHENTCSGLMLISSCILKKLLASGK